MISKKSGIMSSVGPLSDVLVSNDNTLQNPLSLSFIEVVLSNVLKWYLHVDNPMTKAYKQLFILRNMRWSGCFVNLMLSGDSSCVVFRIH